MDHTTIQERLFALYDGELAGEDRRAVEDHVLGCAECRALIARWKQVAGALFPSPHVATSEAFVERVMQRIATPKPPRVRLPRRPREFGWLIPAMGLAAMLLALFSRPMQQVVSVESLLLGENPSGDDVLNLLMEEPS